MKILRCLTSTIIITGIILVASSSASVEAASDNVTNKLFVDETKREVTLKRFPPEKIVSLSPSVTEILFALGLDNKIVGVTKECDYPAAASKKPKVGGYMNFNIEVIVSLKPDLIIMSAEGNIRRKLKEMERLNLTVFVVKTRNIRDLLTTITDIGSVTGKEGAGKKLANSVRSEVDAIKSRLEGIKRKTVFCAVSIDPLIGAGPGTLIGDIIDVCGGDNIIGKNAPDYPVVSLEELYVKNPDVILLATMGSADIKGDKRSIPKKFSNTLAAKNGAVYFVNADIFCRPSYRIIDALKELEEKLQKQ